MSISSIMKEKGFNKSKQLMMSISGTIPRSCILYNNNSTFVSLIHTFSLAGNLIVHKPIQCTNREKYFNQNIYKGKMPTLAGNKHLSVHFFFHRPRFLHLSREKSAGLISHKWTSKWLYPRRHNK